MSGCVETVPLLCHSFGFLLYIIAPDVDVAGTGLILDSDSYHLRCIIMKLCYIKYIAAFLPPSRTAWVRKPVYLCGRTSSLLFFMGRFMPSN